MKNLASIFVVLATVVYLLGSTGCKKEEDTSISYPSSSFYGTNVLALPDSTVLNGDDYSFSAELGNDAELKIVMTNFSATAKTVWFYSNESGWLVSSYIANHQQFQSNTTGTLDAEMFFNYGPGSCQVDFYENGTSITKTKYFTW